MIPRKILVIFAVASGLLYSNGVSAGTVIISSLTDVVDAPMLTVPALATTPGPDGVVSLREALLAVNNTKKADKICFKVSGTISPESALPALEDYSGGTTIDGGGVITLDGYLLSGETNCFIVYSPENVIRGLTIVRFPWLGIYLDGPKAHHNVIEGCRIGTDGVNPLGNGAPGIHLRNASNNRIGGATDEARNIICDNFSMGIIMNEGASYNCVYGNYVGVAEDGITAMVNLGVTIPDEVWGCMGVYLLGEGTGNRIGGPNPGEGNLISANHTDAIRLEGYGVINNFVQGNRLITDYLSEYSIPRIDGIFLASANNNLVGGPNPGEGNIIEGYWDNCAILVHGSRATRNRIQGNTILPGEAVFPGGWRTQAAIHVWYSSCGNLVGGTNPGEGNTVYGQPTEGIRARRGNAVRGNSVYDCGGLGIGDPLNPEIVEKPVIETAWPVTGTAPPCAEIDIFADEANQGRYYLGSVSSDACGRFRAEIDLTEHIGRNLTATATDWTYSTSRFSLDPLPIPPPSEEGASEEGEGGFDWHCFCTPDQHTCDWDGDYTISMSELLRFIQFFQSDGFHCDPSSEDGYATGAGVQNCAPHSGDYWPRDWAVSLRELLRVIQFYNSPGYERVHDPPTEDGYQIAREESPSL